MAKGLDELLRHLHRTLAPPDGGLSDGQLLARFVASRDEASFAALLRRHGPMVWRLCLRVLGHVQNAEDTFQATFLVLACKAASVLKRESVGSFLYGVAYRAALKARAVHARRRSRERQVEEMPHPAVTPADVPDWRPWLDHELNLLPEKYRAVIVGCDLEGRSRKEAAGRLGLSEGTVSSRLARGRRLLARRLSRYGLPLSGGALAVAVSEGASAAVPASLLSSTSEAAVLVAAGQVAAVSGSVEILMKGALQTMLMAKLKVAIGAVMVVAALGASGLAYKASGHPAAERKLDGKPRSELEALRRENELLKLNLEVVLEKVRAQEAELRALRGRPGAGTKPSGATGPQQAGTGRDPYGRPRRPDQPLPPQPPPPARPADNVPPPAPPDPTTPELPSPPQGLTSPDPRHLRDGEPSVAPHRGRTTGTDTLEQVEDALKTLREARDDESRRKAMGALEKALKRLREQRKKPEGSPQ
jgi:RNA polymerase sigma factor (sigma-70 family)